MVDDLSNSLQLAKDGRFEEWLDEFLLAHEKNQGLYDGLKKQKRYWVGPFQVNLDMIKRTCGPEEEIKYKEPKNVWDNIIKNMKVELIKGWKPAPLIATFKNGIFEVADGNHRMYTLMEAGYKKYWTAVWADSESDYLIVKNILSEKLK